LLLVLNKIDLPDARASLVDLRNRFPDIRAISAATGEGVADLTYAVARTIEAAPMPQLVAAPPAVITLSAPSAFHIERNEDGAFVVSGERVERLAAMTDFDSDEGLARFERALGKMGVDKRLQELGAAEGDTVRIGPYEFTYS
jgi:GTP-binding protein